MKTAKRKKVSELFKGPPPKRVCPDREFVDENGVECVETRWDDGEVIVLKIYNPNDPVLKKSRQELSDIPPLNLDQIISELRD